MMDQNSDIVPGDRWGFSGGFDMKSCTGVGNLTEVQGQIPCHPHTGIVWLIIDRCINETWLVPIPILFLFPISHSNVITEPHGFIHYLHFCSLLITCEIK